MYVVLIAAAVRENRGEREGEEVGESKKERNADTKGSERKAKPSDSWIRLMDDFPLQWGGEFIYMLVLTGVLVDAVSAK